LYVKKNRLLLNSCFNTVTLASSYSALPDDGDHTETCWSIFNPLNAELNPICPLLALFGAHHILHVST